jgi:hypothetical protein
VRFLLLCLALGCSDVAGPKHIVEVPLGGHPRSDSGAPGDSAAVDTGVSADTASPAPRLDVELDLQGVLVAMDGSGPLGAGICIALHDRTAAIIGGEVEVLGETVTADDGSWALNGVKLERYFGPLLVAADCEDGAGLMFETVTWIQPSLYRDHQDGQTLSDVVGLGTRFSTFIWLELNLWNEGGSAVNIRDDGMLTGVTRDASGSPLAGVSLSCVDGDCPAYYMQGEAGSTGWLMSGTDGIAEETGDNGRYLIPGPYPCVYHAMHEEQGFGGIDLGPMGSGGRGRIMVLDFQAD